MYAKKAFQCYLGIKGRQAYPHHDGKIDRSTWDKHQYVHYIGNYEVTHVAFVCVTGEQINQEEYYMNTTRSPQAEHGLLKNYRRRREIGMSLVWLVSNDIEKAERPMVRTKRGSDQPEPAAKPHAKRQRRTY